MADQAHEPHDAPKAAGEQPAKRGPRWPWLVAGLIVLASVGTVLWLVYAPRPDVWTNDAYVMVHYATIAPRVSGQVEAVRTDNNDTVKTGDVLVVLDDRDYLAAVASAEAALAKDRALVDDAKSSLARQQSVIDGAAAQVDSSSMQLAMAQANINRSEKLAETGFGAVQTREQADTAFLLGQSALTQTRAGLASAKAQLPILRASVDAAAATVQGQEAALDIAKLNLSYTTIRAPIDGMVAERSVQVGNYVTPGTGLMVVVPLRKVYIEANYLETQLTHVEAGQRARIHVDAYNVDLDGRVVGVPAATGSTFATIPSENATGNFTKISQRLPVEIEIDPDQPLAKLLRAGLSVETTIATGLADVVGDQKGSARDVTSAPEPK